MPSPKYIESLQILHRDDTLDTVIGSKLVLQGGTLMDAIPDASDNSVTLSSNPEAGSVDPELMEKYNKMIAGGTGEYQGVLYTFSGAPYYYASVAGVFPVDGHLYLTVKQCAHWGLFEDGVHPTLVGAVPETGILEITDVCEPCIDCGDYEELYEYMDAIKNRLNYKKDLIYKHTTYVPGSYEQNNILKEASKPPPLLLFFQHCQ